MKKYTVKYTHTKTNEVLYPVSNGYYGDSYTFTKTLSMAYRCACPKRGAMDMGRTFAIRIFHDLYCLHFFGDHKDTYIPNLVEHKGSTWEIVEIEEDPNYFEEKFLYDYIPDKSYLEQIKTYTQKYLDKLLAERKPCKKYDH